MQSYFVLLVDMLQDKTKQKKKNTKNKKSTSWKPEFSFLEFDVKENVMNCKTNLKFEGHIGTC